MIRGGEVCVYTGGEGHIIDKTQQNHRLYNNESANQKSWEGLGMGAKRGPRGNHKEMTQRERERERQRQFKL